MKDRHYVNHNDQVLVVSEKQMEEIKGTPICLLLNNVHRSFDWTT